MSVEVRPQHTRTGRPLAVRLYTDEPANREAVYSLVRMIDVGGRDELRTRVRDLDDGAYGTSDHAKDHALMRCDEILDELLDEQDALTSHVGITVRVDEIPALIAALQAAAQPKPGTGVHLTGLRGGAA